MSFIENVAAVVAVAPELHGNKPINTAVHSTKDGANMGQLALSSNGSNAIQQYTAANQGSGYQGVPASYPASYPASVVVIVQLDIRCPTVPWTIASNPQAAWRPNILRLP